MNLPNKLTVFRIILVPFFVAALLLPSLPYHYLIALLLFAVASYTDHLDGKIARSQGLITDFGKFLDPLADKILVISALVCFVQLQLVNVWLVLIVIAREFMVTSIRLVAVDSGKVIAANQWGKAKTVSQIVAVLLVMLFQGILPFTGNEALFYWLGNGAVLISVVFTVISGWVYLRQNWDIIKTSK